ncbi:MAG: sigma-70 family RNA polymerase sigma factor [Oscillospiraceae bacterium]
MDDTKIVDLFWQRDESAIKETDIKYSRYLTAIFYNILKSDEDAEECVNDTYMGAWNSIPPQKPHVFRAFLGAITRNPSLDCYKKKHSQKRVAGEFSLLLSELEDCIPSDISVEKELDDKEIAKQIGTFLKQQSTMKQQFFVRRYWYCDGIKDISKKYGYSESKIKSSLLETRKKLKKHLEMEGITI